MAEAFGIAGRGRFHDQTGAIRDVVQNHLLHVVALLGMELPSTMYSESVRDEQVKVFRQIPPIEPANLVRGQFRGYRDEPGVAPDSQVETFAALRMEIQSWRWAGVPFLIRAGKSMSVTATEVLVKLHPPALKQHFPEQNYFRFRPGPELSINVGARVKRTGRGLATNSGALGRPPPAGRRGRRLRAADHGRHGRVHQSFRAR